VEEPVLGQFLVDAGKGRFHAWARRLLVPVGRKQEQACVQPVPAERGDVAFLFLVVALLLHRGANVGRLRPVAVDRDGDVSLLVQRQEALQGDPAHRFRKRVVVASGAHLPDALVRLLPAGTHLVAQADEEAAVPGVELVLPPHKFVGRADELPVRVELELVVRAVAHPHRRRLPVALQVRQRPLRQVGIAVHVVHDLQLRRGRPGGVQEPREEGPPLVFVAQLVQGPQRQGRVAEPAVAVVPVRSPPIASGREVVGAATMAPEGAKVMSFRVRALRTTASR
jgi:hypothetical protein